MVAEPSRGKRNRDHWCLCLFTTTTAEATAAIAKLTTTTTATATTNSFRSEFKVRRRILAEL